jgi:D-alanyl-D-alanine carboxypeptidase
MGGKTGFISKAGYCFATLLRLPQGNPVAFVVLGAKSNLGRFWETRHLFNWLTDKAGDLVGAKDSESK